MKKTFSGGRIFAIKPEYVNIEREKAESSSGTGEPIFWGETCKSGVPATLTRQLTSEALRGEDN